MASSPGPRRRYWKEVETGCGGITEGTWLEGWGRGNRPWLLDLKEDGAKLNFKSHLSCRVRVHPQRQLLFDK
jgi:hypothetical protein